MAEPQRQAASFVGTLAQLQDSERILASNSQAAQEALARLQRAKDEEAAVRARIEALQAESKALWQQRAAEIEAMTAQIADMRVKAQREYDEKVSAGAAKASEAVRAVREEIKAIEREIAAARREKVAVDEEVAQHRAVLAGVRKDMESLRARLLP